ncbi:MAG: sulfotransferase [Candidatus Hodarchaeota archaeon]
MRSSYTLKNKRRIFEVLYRLFPVRVVLEKPVFIIGCGRSGTTILGQLLSQHTRLAYLNEPRDLWIQGYPQTDIWSINASQVNGKLYMTKHDTNSQSTAKLKRLFLIETRLQGKARLVEKLPINSFRLDFIAGIFPDAQFIHLIRNGVAVAKSIAKLADEGLWFGEGEYKWYQLMNFARQKVEYRSLVKLCRDNYTRGLLEWRMSVESIQAYTSMLSKDRFLELRYEFLLDDPLRACRLLEDFLGEMCDRGMHHFAMSQVRRKSSQLSENSPHLHTYEIAGSLLHRLGYQDEFELSR